MPADSNTGFAMTQVIAGVILQRGDTYLLVQEKKVPVTGKWSFPSGRVAIGESLEEAAVREAKEETGFDVVLGSYHFVLHQETERPVLHAFSATIADGELHFPASEILDARWFAYEEIVEMQADLRNAEFVLGAITSQQAQVQ